MLVVVSGLPGVGKSTVAAALAARWGATHLSIDEVEDALLGCGLPAGERTGVAAYEAVRAAAQQNLALGNTVVVDAVNDSEPARETWRRAARATDRPLRFVLLALEDADEQRRRLTGRLRGHAHLPEPAWSRVEQVARGYADWAGDEVVRVDADAPPNTVLERVLALVTGGSTPR
jgi:predicted kinase